MTGSWNLLIVVVEAPTAESKRAAARMIFFMSSEYSMIRSSCVVYMRCSEKRTLAPPNTSGLTLPLVYDH